MSYSGRDECMHVYMCSDVIVHSDAHSLSNSLALIRIMSSPRAERLYNLARAEFTGMASLKRWTSYRREYHMRI